LSETKARSRVGGYFFLSDNTQDNNHPPKPNGPVYTPSTILKVVVSSATEAELGALFYNAKDAVTIPNILTDLGYNQPATPLQTDNACASGIINKTVKQRWSKAIDMRFYWLQDRVKQKQFTIFLNLST
jgi:hypothetical protein